MDYGCAEKRRTKGDLKKKRKQRAYKRGGKFRSMEILDEKKEPLERKKQNLPEGRALVISRKKKRKKKKNA